MIVDHSAPIHDAFCRCRNCKPSLVGQSHQSALRVRVAAVLMTMVVIGLAFVR